MTKRTTPTAGKTSAAAGEIGRSVVVLTAMYAVFLLAMITVNVGSL